MVRAASSSLSAGPDETLAAPTSASGATGTGRARADAAPRPKRARPAPSPKPSPPPEASDAPSPKPSPPPEASDARAAKSPPLSPEASDARAAKPPLPWSHEASDARAAKSYGALVAEIDAIDAKVGALNDARRALASLLVAAAARERAAHTHNVSMFGEPQLTLLPHEMLHIDVTCAGGTVCRLKTSACRNVDTQRLDIEIRAADAPGARH
jgi:hypothetical protein